MKRLLTPALYLWLASCSPEPVLAQTVYFSSPPFTLVNGSTTSGPAIMGNFNRVVSDGNTAYTNFLALISGLSGAPTPAGAVVPFNLSACPAGWIPSNGTAGTVDLRGKFIRGTTGSPAVGTVQADLLLTHTHNVPGTLLSSATFSTTAFSNAPTTPISDGTGPANVSTAISGNFGSETRPKNVALLYCQKT